MSDMSGSIPVLASRHSTVRSKLLVGMQCFALLYLFGYTIQAHGLTGLQHSNLHNMHVFDAFAQKCDTAVGGCMPGYGRPWFRVQTPHYLCGGPEAPPHPPLPWQTQ